MARTSGGRSLVVLSCVLLLIANCVVRGPVTVKPLAVAEPVRVKSPVKAHLTDGSTIVYPDGVSVAGGKLMGVGTQFDLTLKEVGRVGEVALEKVVALESFENTPNRGLTALASGGTTVAVVVGAAVLLKAIFGSCPTVYADVHGERQLEAELFSYSIAPLFEAADVDRLRAKPDANGIIQLDVRNEALETHYLNQLEVLEVRHDSDEIVVPDEKGRPLALRNLSAPAAMVDRRGRDLRPLLDSRDDRVFRTDAATLGGVTREDLRDSIELRLPVPPGHDEVALILNLRNSLLNTVLFYDMMLKRPGARSLDWLSHDLGEIGPALDLASWYSSRMGMRVEVWRDGAYREVTHIGDTGPIAWKEMAVILPVEAKETTLRVRLSFVADNWRIDQIQFATGVRKPETRSIPIAEVASSDGALDALAARSLAAADGNYLQTFPGQSFRARFDAGVSSSSRTFLLQSRGYYTEWVRGSWATPSSPSATFTPSDEALLEALVKWRNVQGDFEARFDATRIPVR